VNDTDVIQNIKLLLIKGKKRWQTNIGAMPHRVRIRIAVHLTILSRTHSVRKLSETRG
jgi:hypothetical protein